MVKGKFAENIMKMIVVIKTMFGYWQFSVSSLYFRQTKIGTQKSFSVTTNQDYSQQKNLLPKSLEQIYDEKLKGRDILFSVVTKAGKY